MEKHKYSNNKQKTGKFHINIGCQSKIDDNNTTKEWLTIISELKPTNYKDKNRILLGILDKYRNVVVKIGPTETLKKEYSFGRMLHKRVPGYINFICFFECEDDYSKYPNNTKNYLCENGSVSNDLMKILVMEYYSLGNILNFPWDSNNLFKLKSCLKQIVLSYFQAFIQFRFIHNDSHLQNILLKRTKKEIINYTVGDIPFNVESNGLQIVIMDMENSLISSNIKDITFIYRDIGRIIADLAYNIKSVININECVDIFVYLMKNDTNHRPQVLIETIFKKIDLIKIKK